MTRISDQGYPRTYRRGDPNKGLVEAYVLDAYGATPRTLLENGQRGRPSAVYRSEASLQRAGYVLTESEEDKDC